MPMKTEFIAQLEQGFKEVLGKGIGEIPVFLRSDTNMEDLKNFTGAGLNLAAGNYTKPKMRKSLFNRIKAANVQGTAAGKWSARKAQLLAKRYKAAGGGYR